METIHVEGCNKKGFGIEIKVYDTSHIANIETLVSRFKVLKPSLHFSIVLGIGGGAPVSIRNLLNMVELLLDRSTWQVVTIGKLNLRTTIIALCMGWNRFICPYTCTHLKKFFFFTSNSNKDILHYY